MVLNVFSSCGSGTPLNISPIVIIKVCLRIIIFNLIVFICMVVWLQRDVFLFDFHNWTYFCCSVLFSGSTVRLSV